MARFINGILIGQAKQFILGATASEEQNEPDCTRKKSYSLAITLQRVVKRIIIRNSCTANNSNITTLHRRNHMSAEKLHHI